MQCLDVEKSWGQKICLISCWELLVLAPHLVAQLTQPSCYCVESEINPKHNDTAFYPCIVPDFHLSQPPLESALFHRGKKSLSASCSLLSPALKFWAAWKPLPALADPVTNTWFISHAKWWMYKCNPPKVKTRIDERIYRDLPPWKLTYPLKNQWLEN